ncbi:MAG: RsiV family protein [Treponema sp.]|nr:RsiV family protein [Treponema sp.]
MKKLYLIIPVILFLLSCSDKEEIIQKHYQYNKVFADNHHVEFDIYLENIGNSRKISNLIKKLIYDNKSFDKYILEIEKRFLQYYEDSSLPRMKNPDGTEYFYSSYLNENYIIIFNDDSFVIMEYSDYYYYTGTAHGHFLTNYYIIDIENEKILELNEIINPIPDFVLKEIIKNQYGIEDFLRDNIWPPDSINIDQTGIELLWNIYSITPYVFGSVHIEIPRENAASFLTEKGMEITKAVTQQ